MTDPHFSGQLQEMKQFSPQIYCFRQMQMQADITALGYIHHTATVLQENTETNPLSFPSSFKGSISPFPTKFPALYNFCSKK